MSSGLKKLPFAEFISLMALMIALNAFLIDAILPALSLITEEMQLSDSNDVQLMVSSMFLGMAIGTLFYGPVSDSVGRKPVTLVGFLLFFVGSALCIYASTFEYMILGRVIQGVGLAAPRVVVVAIIRDLHEGPQMAKIFSFVMAIFVLAPAVAPAMGEGIMLFAGWRTIFTVFWVMAVFILIWFYWRQPETLAPENKRKFNFSTIRNGFWEYLKFKKAIGYTLANGFITGAFVGYLSLVQPIYQEQYQLGKSFSIYFACLALSVGIAGFFNGKLVHKVGMYTLTSRALWVMVLCSLLFLGVSQYFEGHPAFWSVFVYCTAMMFGMGVVFGNMSALAMEPLGHIAGTGSALIGAISTLLSVPLGVFIGQCYSHGVEPLVLGYAILALMAVLTMWLVEKKDAKGLR